MTSALRVRDVCKTFIMSESNIGAVSLMHALRHRRPEAVTREIKALSNVSFDVQEGERVGIIGRNGAGKTTLLSLLAGITVPTSGSVEVVGDVHAMLTIGAVLRDEATGRENIFLDGAVHGRTRGTMERIAGDIITFAELEEFIDRPVRTYSSGMKARLAFAMGAFIDPDILIVDETLSVGDAFFSAKASRRMKEIAAAGRIVLMVSHGLGSIVDMCDRCLWMENGGIAMDGKPADVTAAYQAAVSQADEAELRRKFSAGTPFEPQPMRGRLNEFAILQSRRLCAATVRAFTPLQIQVKGAWETSAGVPALELRIERVDGRSIWAGRADQTSDRPLPAKGSFCVKVDFEPFILGADLYSIEVTLFDGDQVVDRRRRAFEVVDEEGQFGGKPLLFLSPQVTSRSVSEYCA